MKIFTEIPPPYPSRRPEVLAAALAALESGDWARLEGAPETEAALREFHGGGEIWWVASGTAAIEAILVGHGIGPDDEVITVSYTWGATVAAILAIGAVPVFADVDPLTGLIDPERVLPLISPRTRAILAVHLFGRPCDAIRLRQIADEAGIYLFEDGSQAHGARLCGRRVGRFGHASAFSCMGLKPLAGTEGGYAVFEDPAAAERAYLHGKHPRGLAPDRAAALSEQGLLDSLQLGWRPCAVGAALARAALPFLDQENAARRRNAEHLRALLENVPWVEMPPEPLGAETVHHLMSLIYREELAGIPRADFLARLESLGVSTFVYIPLPIHRLRRMNWRDPGIPPAFWHRQLREARTDYSSLHLPGAEWRSENTFEMAWNWTTDNPLAMEQIAQALAAGSTGILPVNEKHVGRDARFGFDHGQDAHAPFFDPYHEIDIHERNLPHWQQDACWTFITWRLADSLPAGTLRGWMQEKALWIERHPEPWDAAAIGEFQRQFSARMDEWLDAGQGACVLSRLEIRQVVVDALRHFDGQRYELSDFVVMPNHIHVLFRPMQGFEISKIVHTWKSFAAKQINRILQRSGSLWQEEYWDRLIRNERHFAACQQYIAENPIRARLAPTAYTIRQSEHTQHP
jgi:dTDP-4-amino-4,6-dideoxygalactose transaminase/REP element-mobilizing transposase RayT